MAPTLELIVHFILRGRSKMRKSVVVVGALLLAVGCQNITDVHFNVPLEFDKQVQVVKFQKPAIQVTTLDEFLLNTVHDKPLYVERVAYANINPTFSNVLSYTCGYHFYGSSTYNEETFLMLDKTETFSVTKHVRCNFADGATYGQQ